MTQQVYQKKLNEIENLQPLERILLIAKKTQRWSYFCTGCQKKYNNQCVFTKYKYDSKKAQNKAEVNLIDSRKGIDIDSKKFQILDKIVKNGIDNKKYVYQIAIENKDAINKFVTILYRYVNNGYLTTKRIDLPYAAAYKKIKNNKKYDYSKNKTIDRTGHTYIDYLAYIHKHPVIYIWQLDFLEAIKTDNNNILSFILLDLIKILAKKKLLNFLMN